VDLFQYFVGQVLGCERSGSNEEVADLATIIEFGNCRQKIEAADPFDELYPA
jgi:hypothetical protein